MLNSNYRIELFSLVDKVTDISEYMGISYIKSYLESKGVSCGARVITYDEFDDVILEFDNTPMLIGISMYCDTHGLVKVFCDKIKKIFKQRCHIVIGGPHVYNYEINILESMPSVDSVCTGDGEEVMFELVQCLVRGKPLSLCKGLTFRDNGRIIKNPHRKNIQNLDMLPFPHRERNINNQKRFFYITGSRGCTGRCAFCSEYITGGAEVRLRSPKNIVDEIELLYKTYGVKKYIFTDPTFEAPGRIGLEKACGIFREIIERKLKLRLVFNSRSDIVSQNSDLYYELAYQAGVECIFLGLEAGNNGDLCLYNKGSSVQTNLEAIKKIQSHNIYVNYGFIFFNPYSTYQSLQSNLNFLYNSNLIFNSWHILHQFTIMPQATMKDKLINDRLIDKFNYDSDVARYRFQHTEIGSLYQALKREISTKHLVDFDSQIAIDRIYFSKSASSFYLENLLPIFEEVNCLWKKRNKYLYDFFSEAIYLHERYGNGGDFDLFLKSYIAHEYDRKIKILYVKYLRECKINDIAIE